MSELTAVPAAAPAIEASPTMPPFDWRALLARPEARVAIALFAALCLAFAPFMRVLWGLWFEADSLYSHGPLIPLMAAYVVYERWSKLREIPVRGATWVIVPIALVMYVTWFASRTIMPGVLSSLFMVLAALSVLFVGGWRWFLATIGPILFLVFALPLWSGIVDRVTQPLQVLSTDMAVRMLDICGLHPLQTDATTVYLDHFQFDVAAACSGAKTTLALLAFAVFFILLNRGRWYSSVALLVILLPFSLAINGLRIALIGIVGNSFGNAAGLAFHDYGAYGVLIVCFLLLGQITRLLGFK